MGKEAKVKVLVCGGGNGAHTMAGLASSRPDTEARVLTLFRNEAEKWTSLLEENDFLVQTPTGDVTSKPSLVTKDPSVAVPGADVIVFTVPAFAHELYMETIAPFIDPNTLIVGMPGQPGFEFQVMDILKDKAKKCAVLSFETLPWACRILEFGRKVEVLGVKETMAGSLIEGEVNLPRPPMEMFQALLGDHPTLHKVHNFVEPYLMTKSIVHPPLMYGRWRNWDGQPLDEKPLFYQGADEFSAGILSKVSDECVATARALTKQSPLLDLSEVQHLHDWYKRDYEHQITDNTSLHSCLQTNSAYAGLLHPMKATEEGKFMPDFRYRYLMEDVPFGLAVTKGLAQLAGVETPASDEVLAWCQTTMGKEYLVGSKLEGKDLKDTRAPQRYGIHTVQDLIKLL